MIYKEIINKELNTRAEVSFFEMKSGISEYHVMLHVESGSKDFKTQLDCLQQAYKELVPSIFKAETVAVMKRYFLSDATNQTGVVTESEKQYAPCAVSIVQQAPLDGSKVALWVYLQSGIRTTFDGLFVAEHNGYTHYWTAGLNSAKGDSEEQTHTLLDNYEKTLEKHQCDIEKDCVRTWFFVQNVDVNYAGVVKARKENFATHGMTEKTHYISSTGIEGRHADPKVSVLLDAYAVKGLWEGQQKFLYALTHLNPTYEYGVTFERGTAILYGDRIQSYISGTASIDNKGNVLYVGDITKQVYRMWENVETLLAEADGTFSDLSQMIVYLRDMADYGIVKKMFDERFPNVPKVVVLASVCRPTWLIEMECIAVKEQCNPKFRNF